MSGPTHALSLYLDTSVVGGYHDPEFMSVTRELWRLREAGLFRFISSVVVDREIAGAPERVRELMRTTFAAEPLLALTPEADALASAYLTHKVVPAGYEDDAYHVAVCTVARIDFLVSWNFKHLTNARREAGFNAVNLLQGYPTVRMVAPTFLIHGQEEKTF
ncbi:MAG: PIN domain protein [Opitutaceae bacterium]